MTVAEWLVKYRADLWDRGMDDAIGELEAILAEPPPGPLKKLMSRKKER